MVQMLLTLLVICLYSFGSFAQNSLPTKKIDSLFSSYNTLDQPGVALGIIKDGTLVYSKGYGSADLEHDVAISDQTVFYAASVSKHFITFAVLLLEEQGKIDLDAKIQRYLPDFPDYGYPLTIRHFIHHTSGVRDYLTLWTMAGNDYLDKMNKRAVYEMIIRQESLNFKPGEKYLYSNSCYLLLAMIIEKASGLSLDEFAQRFMFQPLNMHNTHFHDNVYHLVKNRAFSYSPRGDEFDNLIMRFDMVGSGGLYTNVEDLAKWDANMNTNHLGKGGQEIIQKMHEMGLLNNGESTGYAFALRIEKYRGLNTVGHGGAMAGYRTYYLRFPEQGISLIVLSNRSDFESKKSILDLADIVLKDEFTSEKPIEEAPRRSEQTLSSFEANNLKEYQGTFYSRELDTHYKFKVDDNQLYLSIGYGIVEELRPVKKDHFDGRFKVRFLRNKEGKIIALIVDAGRVTNMEFKKVD